MLPVVCIRGSHASLEWIFSTSSLPPFVSPPSFSSDTEPGELAVWSSVVFHPKRATDTPPTRPLRWKLLSQLTRCLTS